MITKHALKVAALALGLGCPLNALAQPADGDAAQDKSGTNPTTLNRSFSINNDLRFLPKDRWLSQATMRFTQPFNDSRMSIALKAPVAMTNVRGRDETGLGDISAKWNWVAYLDRRQGVLVSTEVTAPSAGKSVFGSGKWGVAPGLTYAYFLTPEWIVAPALVHNVSFAGDRARADVNRSDVDLYLVYKPKGRNWWLTSDLTVGYDFVARTTPATWKVALGTNVGKIGDAALNLSIRPGVGIGRDKPMRWSLEVGLAAVGF